MGKIIEQKINDFSLGMTNDYRTPDTRYSRLLKNFDAHTFKHKLLPFRSSEDGDNDPTNNQFRNFNAESGTLYALGVISSSSALAKVKSKALSTGASADLGDNTWTAPANNQSASGATDFNLFGYYKNQNKVYGTRSARYVWSFSTIGGAFNDTEVDLGSTFTNSCQGITHSKDDIFYFGWDNNIAKNNAGSWTGAALTLPKNLYVTSICESGNYLAIACAPISGFGKSVVYLWDRDASLATLSESIDWGEGNLKILEVIDGVLVGISISANSNTTFNQKIIFRYLNGGRAEVFKELQNDLSSAASLALPIAKQKVNNYLYFLLDITMNSNRQAGVWKIGKNKEGNLVVVMDRPANNDTALASTDTLQNFIIVGEYAFIAYTNGSASNIAISKTDDTNKNNVTSVYETVILNDGDSSIVKKLLGITIFNEPLTSNSQITIKYSADNNIAGSIFTTIFTYDGTSSSAVNLNALFHSAINIESSGGQLPQYKEIIFRIELKGYASSAGALSAITGLKYKSEIIDKDFY